MIVTILRDARERLRSKYYSRRHNARDDALNMSFYDWMECLERKALCQKMMNFALSRNSELSEYKMNLGGGDVLRSKCLATRFDVDGITEHMDEAALEIERQLGKPLTLPVPVFKARDNSGEKQPWTEIEWAKADSLVVDDMNIYEFAKNLTMHRLLSAWGSREALEQSKQRLYAVAVDFHGNISCRKLLKHCAPKR